MLQIPNVQTSAAYTDACQLGPDAFEALTVNVWNFAAIMEIHTAPEGGYQVGEWADEVLCPPGQYNLERCGGARFKTNPATPTTPARIIAAGWRDGEPRVIGGVEYTTTLGASGNPVPPAAAALIVTGRINGIAGSIVQGSGFSLLINGVGDYILTFSPAFPAAPCVPAPGIMTAGRLFGTVVTVTASQARFNFFDNAGTATDVQFIFYAATMV